ncbi:apolipoprotein N-acyltransferase [Arcticibacter sp.]|uniref:apolipoprotein N-acyltransferase n=1 Tax=Arcticibacter sp. TaxID=1872630 RepID=UPI00388FF527
MKRNYFLAVISAFLLWLAWPPMSFTAPILLVALVPLLRAVENVIQSSLPRKGRKVFLLSGLTFLIWNTSCIYWVFNSLNAVLDVWVASLISLIPFGLAAILMTLAFWLYFQLRRTSGKLISYLGLISFWIAYEYLHQSWDLQFPWMNLGNGFAETPRLVQWYEFTGVYGGTLWILVANILAFELSEQDDSATLGYQLKKKLAVALSIWVAIPIAGSVMMYTGYVETSNPANVVVVQPNIDPYDKWSKSPEKQIDDLIRLSDSVGQANTEYFIWPETAISRMTEEYRIHSDLNFLKIQAFLSKYKNGNVLSGIESFKLYDKAETPSAAYNESFGKYLDYYNAAIHIENSSKVQFYHKSKLVPGVESLPFATALSFMKPIFAAFGGSSGGFGKQDKPSVFFSQSGMGVAPVICYESIWGSYVAEYIRDGAQFIAIITNDAWWGNTSGKDQHLAYARLRAIETRRWVARSANTGISAFINQRGDVIQAAPWWVPTALKQEINLNSDLTFYVRYGDWIAWAGCVLAVGLIILMLIRRRSVGS